MCFNSSITDNSVCTIREENEMKRMKIKRLWIIIILTIATTAQLSGTDIITQEVPRLVFTAPVPIHSLVGGERPKAGRRKQGETNHLFHTTPPCGRHHPWLPAISPWLPQHVQTSVTPTLSSYYPLPGWWSNTAWVSVYYSPSCCPNPSPVYYPPSASL